MKVIWVDGVYFEDLEKNFYVVFYCDFDYNIVFE